jgi:hypothetical protein
MSSTGSSKHPGQVAQARPDHGNVRIERMGVNHRRHSVSGVVEAVHKFKAEGDQEGQAEQQIRPDADDGYRAEVRRDMEANVAESACQRQRERHYADAA